LDSRELFSFEAKTEAADGPPQKPKASCLTTQHRKLTNENVPTAEILKIVQKTWFEKNYGCDIR